MTSYVDAGQAIPHQQLSAVKGSAPATGTVDYDRILDARTEPQNWLTYYGTYDGQRYSELDQITKENVKRLSPVWVFQAGATGMQSGAST
nr:PQQ-dependent dehydrogenase, methanol/ethanol family [Geodermatophilaceae bacterium]